MKIFYGLMHKKIDVTQICLNKLTRNNFIKIPSGDLNRAHFFTDPIYGIRKKIFILNDDVLTDYDESYTILIHIIDNTIHTISNLDIDSRLENIHSKLLINYGDFTEELPEQKMVARYLTGNENVLEIGSNIGRNSLVIAHILSLHNNNNFVTLECNPNIAKQLAENRDLNHLSFHIETAALSNRKLIQRGWDTKVSDVLLDDYNWVDTVTLKQLQDKYNITFDTLILDCEGAFYYILIDMPQILQNINLIIMENDYWDYNHKLYIDNVLKQNNFFVDYSESGGWGPCFNNFFEVWKKQT